MTTPTTDPAGRARLLEHCAASISESAASASDCLRCIAAVAQVNTFYGFGLDGLQQHLGLPGSSDEYLGWRSSQGLPSSIRCTDAELPALVERGRFFATQATDAEILAGNYVTETATPAETAELFRLYWRMIIDLHDALAPRFDELIDADR